MPADDTKWVAQVWIRQRRAADPLLHSYRSVLDRCPELDPLGERGGEAEQRDGEGATGDRCGGFFSLDIPP